MTDRRTVPVGLGQPPAVALTEPDAQQYYRTRAWLIRRGAELTMAWLAAERLQRAQDLAALVAPWSTLDGAPPEIRAEFETRYEEWEALRWG